MRDEKIKAFAEGFAESLLGGIKMVELTVPEKDRSGVGDAIAAKLGAILRNGLSRLGLSDSEVETRAHEIEIMALDQIRKWRLEQMDPEGSA
ncbi:MAG: hypothetical protein RO009_17170 [Pseudorhodoplanes sp.]|jgi:hypothetical protein|nr:hypothetical protein [Pseudorhodoplanes sp.]